MASKRDFINDLGKQSVALIERSDWPVRTGASKRGFGFEQSDDEVRITNTTDYAVYVEARTGIVRDTLEGTQFEGEELAEWLASMLR